MASSQSVIDALMAAVNATPDDDHLRCHLAGLLCEAGDAEAAISHYKHVLVTNPAHIDALKGAALVSKQLGDVTKASAYEKLHLALAGGDPQPVSDSVDTPVVEKQPVANVTSIAPSTNETEYKGSQSWEPKIITGSKVDTNVIELDRDALQPTMNLDDVAGLDDVKRRLHMSFLKPILNPELANRYGKKVRGGLLLYGPPGCGKTYIARALAGELKANFISIGLEDILSKWVGESEHNLHGMFENARQMAPTLIFLDELDALGRKRSDLGSSSTRELVNQLLVELDGVSGSDEPIYVLGATNLPWDIDDALKRPGRFDRTVFVSPPDAEARAKIIELNLESKPVEGVNIADVVKRTRGYSGADVNYVCEMATEAAMEDALTSNVELPISKKHFKSALKESNSSIRSWFENAKNYVRYSNSDGQYNQLAEYIADNKP